MFNRYIPEKVFTIHLVQFIFSFYSYTLGICYLFTEDFLTVGTVEVILILTHDGVKDPQMYCVLLYILI